MTLIRLLLWKEWIIKVDRELEAYSSQVCNAKTECFTTANNIRLRNNVGFTLVSPLAPSLLPLQASEAKTLKSMQCIHAVTGPEEDKTEEV